MVIDKKIWVGAKFYFVQQHVIITTSDSIDKEILPWLRNFSHNGEAKILELFSDVF